MWRGSRSPGNEKGMTLLRNRRERVLAVVLGAILSVLLLAGGIRWVWDWRRALRNEIERLEIAELQAEGWLAEAGHWKARGRWLAAHQPTLSEPREQSLRFLEELETTARAEGLTVTARTMEEADTVTGRLPIRLEAGGPFSGLVGWLHTVQRPENFVLVGELTVAAAEEPDHVKCRVQFVRCHRPAAPERTP